MASRQCTGCSMRLALLVVALLSAHVSSFIVPHARAGFRSKSTRIVRHASRDNDGDAWRRAPSPAKLLQPLSLLPFFLGHAASATIDSKAAIAPIQRNERVVDKVERNDQQVASALGRGDVQTAAANFIKSDSLFQDIGEEPPSFSKEELEGIENGEGDQVSGKALNAGKMRMDAAPDGVIVGPGYVEK